MMLKLIIALLFSTSVWGTSTKHPIYDQILRNKPSINKVYAMKLSNIIYKVSIKYGVPKHIYCAILMQESGYTLDAINKIDAYVDGEIRLVSTDFSIAQIHIRTAFRYNFSINRLLTDLNYAINAGAIVLSGMKRYSNLNKDWWTRYNCGTKGTTKRTTCQIYKRLVGRYL